jgi:hypothetical protein
MSFNFVTFNSPVNTLGFGVLGKGNTFLPQIRTFLKYCTFENNSPLMNIIFLSAVKMLKIIQYCVISTCDV